MSSSRGSVLYVCPALGGVARVAKGACAALSQRGWDVRRVPLVSGAAPLREAKRALQIERDSVLECDVIHIEHGSNDLTPFWFAVLAGRLRRDVVTVVHDPPLVAHAPGASLISNGNRVRDVMAYRVLSPLADTALRRVYARRVAVSVVLSERARDDWKVNTPPHVSVLSLAETPPFVQYTPSRGRHVLFAGYLGPSKGLDLLLDAWADLGSTAHPLVIAGTVAGENGTAYLEALHVERQAGNAPVWLGALDDDSFARAIAEASIVVVPYRRSNPASGIVVSAMAAGRAIVGTAVPAVTDFLTDEVDGLVVPVGDRDALTRALERLLGDPALRDRLGAAAGARAAREHTWDAHCATLERAYAVAGTRTRPAYS